MTMIHTSAHVRLGQIEAAELYPAEPGKCITLTFGDPTGSRTCIFLKPETALQVIVALTPFAATRAAPEDMEEAA